MPSATTMNSRTAPAGSAGSDFVQQADAGNFDDLVLQAPGPVVVEFMSYSCAHCGAMEPVLQQVAKALQTRQLFVRVNVALDAELAARYGIQSTPTIVLFQGGREVGRFQGPLPGVPELQAAVTLPFGA
jgi:thioredoxin-like negative regulator of GroEL